MEGSIKSTDTVWDPLVTGREALLLALVLVLFSSGELSPELALRKRSSPSVSCRASTELVCRSLKESVEEEAEGLANREDLAYEGRKEVGKTTPIPTCRKRKLFVYR